MLNTNINRSTVTNPELGTTSQSGSASPLLAQVGSLKALTPPVLRSYGAAHGSANAGTTMRRWLRRFSIGVLAVLTMAIGYLLLVNLVWTGLAAGTVAPQFAGTALDGSQIDLAQERGQPVMLTFWSPDCFACREEVPALQALASDPNTNMQLITVVSRTSRQKSPNLPPSRASPSRFWSTPAATSPSSTKSAAYPSPISSTKTATLTKPSSARS
ncbi:MAG: redoxin domain-containing protein [Caldilineaceae bacterium]